MESNLKRCSIGNGLGLPSTFMKERKTPRSRPRNAPRGRKRAYGVSCHRTRRTYGSTNLLLRKRLWWWPRIWTSRCELLLLKRRGERATSSWVNPPTTCLGLRVRRWNGSLGTFRSWIAWERRNPSSLSRIRWISSLESRSRFRQLPVARTRKSWNRGPLKSRNGTLSYLRRIATTLPLRSSKVVVGRWRTRRKRSHVRSLGTLTRGTLRDRVRPKTTTSWESRNFPMKSQKQSSFPPASRPIASRRTKKRVGRSRSRRTRKIASFRKRETWTPSLSPWRRPIVTGGIARLSLSLWKFRVVIWDTFELGKPRN